MATGLPGLILKQLEKIEPVCYFPKKEKHSDSSDDLKVPIIGKTGIQKHDAKRNGGHYIQPRQKPQ